MRNVSAEYLEAIRARARVDRLTGTITLAGGTEIPLSESNIASGSASISKQCITGEELEFGSVVLSQLDLAVRTDLSRYAFYRAKVSLTYSIQLSNETWYDVPLGVYKVAEANKKNLTVQLTAYDNLQALDKAYDGVQIYGTPFEVLSEISEICGIPLGQTEDEISALPNGDQSVQIDETSGCSTYRDCVRVVAQMLAAFVFATEVGGMALRNFSKEPVATLTSAHRYTPTIADFVSRYAGIVVRSNKGQFAAYDTSIDEGLEMIMDAAAWDYGDEDTLQARTQALLDELAQLYYTPCNFDMPGDPALECGDMLRLPTTDQDVITIITSYKWTFRGKMSVESAGKNPYLKSVNPRQSQIIRELERQTTYNKLIFYSFTNTAEVKAEGTEIKPLASVTFVTVEDTSAMFLAQLPVSVAVDDVVTTTEEEKAIVVKDSTGAETTILDAEGNPLTLSVVTVNTDIQSGEVDLQIFYYLNDALIDYQLVERMTAGSHILSLFYPFAELKANTSNKFEVRILATGGSVTVTKRALKSTITGQGLSATTVWGGTITIEEIVAPFGITGRMTLAKVVEEIITETQIPTPASIVETVATFSLRGKMSLVGFAEEVNATATVEQNTIAPTTTEQLTQWWYVDRYVGIGESGVQLSTSWAYQSAEAEIDSGRITVVKAVTNDLTSVESVEVVAK